MFEHLRKYNRIIVTGPHRSGTRIVSKMIAHDLNRVFVDEALIWDSWVAAKAYSDWLGTPVAYHGVLLLRTMLECKWLSEADCVIWCERDRSEILASMDRLGRSNWDDELSVWNEQFPENASECIVDVKSAVWEHVIQPGLPCHSESIPYSVVAGHPMFIPKERRAGFLWHQTTMQSELFPDVSTTILAKLLSQLRGK